MHNEDAKTPRQIKDAELDAECERAAIHNLAVSLERKRVALWLRHEAETCGNIRSAFALQWAAGKIERGTHCR